VVGAVANVNASVIPCGQDGDESVALSLMAHPPIVVIVKHLAKSDRAFLGKGGARDTRPMEKVGVKLIPRRLKTPSLFFVRPRVFFFWQSFIRFKDKQQLLD
jgi:hypothetical protein